MVARGGVYFPVRPKTNRTQETREDHLGQGKVLVRTFFLLHTRKWYVKEREYTYTLSFLMCMY